MRQPWTHRDLRGLRILSDYGLTDSECAEHLGLSPIAARQMRERLGVVAKPASVSLLRDHDVVPRRSTRYGWTRPPPSQS